MHHHGTYQQRHKSIMPSASELFQAYYPTGLKTMPIFILYALQITQVPQLSILYPTYFWKLTPSCLFAIEFPKPLHQKLTENVPITPYR